MAPPVLLARFAIVLATLSIGVSTRAAGDELTRLRTEFDNKVAALQDRDLPEEERSARIHEVVATYRVRLLDLQRLRNASDDDADAERARREIDRIDVAFPPPAPPPAGIPGGLEKGLVLHYTFDRPEGGVVHDGSGHGNHGAACAAVWNPRGRSGGAYRFEEPGEHIEAGSSPSLCPTGAISVSATVCSTLPPKTAQYVVSKSGPGAPAYWLGMSESRTVTAGIRRGTGGGRTATVRSHESGRTVDYRRWTHIAFTYDGKQAVTYVNGQPDQRVRVDGPICSSDSPLNIGRHGDGRWHYGSPTTVDDVMIWNRALTEVEMLGLTKWLEQTRSGANHGH